MRSNTTSEPEPYSLNTQFMSLGLEDVLLLLRERIFTILDFCSKIYFCGKIVTAFATTNFRTVS